MGCVALSHSVHLMSLLHNLLMWLVVSQHLKHMLLSFTNALLSSKGFARKVRHWFSECLT